MLSNITNIWRKELMDTIRDRKAFRQALLMPLFIGIFYAVINPLLTSVVMSKASDPVTMPAQGVEYADDQLVQVLKGAGITLFEYEGDLQAAIAAGKESAGLIIPQDFSTKITAEQPATLQVLVNPTTGGPFGGGSFSLERLETALNAYQRAIAGARLQVRNLDPGLLSPITLETQNLSTPAQRAGLFASFMLPILVGLLVVQGGLFIAIDVTAGEKERHTLEALLVTPTSDLEIFGGKLAAVFTMSTFPLVLTLLGYWAASNLLPASMTEGAVLPLYVILGAMALTLPAALLANVVLMIISIRTKTYKDAQHAVVPVSLTVVFTAMGGAFFPPSEQIFYAVPVYGTSALVGKLALGSGLSLEAIALSLVGSLGFAALGVAFALKLFNRERLLYSA
ncbi:MAG TPA: ABC transporter permease [Candidatus Bipolaricaulota bacterium]